MKIKKSFFAIMAVLTLFAASASTSISSFTSVEVNAATHHKNEKKHKKAKKSSKKHKKTTKKSKKKATKKHSKKKVAKKKKKVTKKHVAKKKVVKHVAKTSAGPTPITYSKPTISVNPDNNPVKIEYTNKQYKGFNDQLIIDHSTDGTFPHSVTLKGITYYNLDNSKYKTAITLTLLVKNFETNDQGFFENGSDDTYLSSNNVDKKLYPAWSSFFAMDIPGNSQQVIDLTFIGTDDSTPGDFSSFTFNYEPEYDTDSAISTNLNL
ncbi:hypothetical protein [Apilactobacillus kunkeei]|uniref:hypothetical protein n=1 Tax=Apilactobacillus kunkeei TaxID=148814 RepID=UPI00200B0DCE|nr:hypothetical protein [Apilactobacillus kunkeei]MCK8625707.1 hypothetical protein [Apilactobacillus kunkeei]